MERDEARHQAWQQLTAKLGLDRRFNQLEKPIPIGKTSRERFFVFQSVDIRGDYFNSYPPSYAHQKAVTAYSLLADDDPTYKRH